MYEINCPLHHFYNHFITIFNHPQKRVIQSNRPEKKTKTKKQKNQKKKEHVTLTENKILNKNLFL